MCDQHGIQAQDAVVQRREIIKNLPVDPAALDWPLVGESTIHEEMVMVAAMYAQVPEAVYVYGETGVGRESLCRLVHAVKHKEGFVTIDCASEMASERLAHIEAVYADTATQALYLRNIDPLSLVEQERIAALMVKGLRDSGPRFFLSSSTLTLDQLDGGDIHPAFALHLLQYPLELPPLRARNEDIPSLLTFYAKKLGITLNLNEIEIKLMQQHKWPGNISQLVTALQSWQRLHPDVAVVRAGELIAKTY